MTPADFVSFVPSVSFVPRPTSQSKHTLFYSYVGVSPLVSILLPLSVRATAPLRFLHFSEPSHKPAGNTLCRVFVWAFFRGGGRICHS